MYMEAVVEIPAPTARDSETVVTALETAAVFRAKGDAAEALRWLQRAAESAGDDGDDERTLALARTAADLSRALHQPASTPPAYVSSDQHTPTHSRRLPKPPLRGGAARALEGHDEGEPPQSQTHPSHTPSPPSPGSLNHRPPPPSSRSVAYSSPSSSRPLPAPPGRSAPPAAQSRVPGLPPLSSVPKRIEVRVSDASAATEAEAEADAEAQRLTQPIPAPSAAHFADSPPPPKLRQAARVSVVPSPVEAGLFLVRLLEDGSAPPANAAEALMVLIDPNSTVFSD